MAKAAPTSRSNGSMKMPMPPFDIEALFAANRRSLRAAAEAQSHMISRMTKVSEELFGFVDRRLERDREAAKELAACESPQDAMAVYSKFAETAMKDYSAEIGLLAGVYADQARETLEDAQHQVEETIETAASAAKPGSAEPNGSSIAARGASKASGSAAQSAKGA